jgi:hypothetical protein
MCGNNKKAMGLGSGGGSGGGQGHLGGGGTGGGPGSSQRYTGLAALKKLIMACRWTSSIETDANLSSGQPVPVWNFLFFLFSFPSGFRLPTFRIYLETLCRNFFSTVFFYPSAL